MQFDKKNPIGIFDSGIGGLTVAKAIQKMLPNEDLLYFGDTAHMPYGEKSIAAIQAYTVKICDWMLKRQCKLIVIACNSASAAAAELAKAYTASRAKVLDVINPMTELLAQEYADKKIGLIGTKATINSEVYQKKIAQLAPNADVEALATPLLASMIEEGFFRSSVSQAVIEAYLGHQYLVGVEVLVLACTHYPLIKAEINTFFDGQVMLLDSAELVAKAAKEYLVTQELLNDSSKVGKHKFYVSDLTESFQQTAALFFGKKLKLHHFQLWE